MKVTVGIPTKDRYDQLAQTLQSVVMQSFQDFEVIIVDDSENRIDIRERADFQGLLNILGHDRWRVIWGHKRGQHISHQIIQDEARADFVWRVDDDEIANPDVLGILFKAIVKLDAGAVGGLVLTPPPAMLPKELTTNLIAQSDNNIQWFSHNGSTEPIRVEHLHSTFLYRKGLARYDFGLSPVSHREETLFTYEISRKGHGVYVIPQAKTWHLRSPTGGIRSHQNPKFYEDDEKLFQTKLAEWGVNGTKTKVVVLDSGRGDHVVFKSILPELKDYKVIIGSCYDDIFKGEDVELISIAEAKNRYGNIDRYNIYRSMIDWDWKGSLQDAYRKLYL